MSVDHALENCTDRSDACLISGHTSSMCQDCDGLGSVGALPCGRCAGSGIDPTSPNASGERPEFRADYGAIGNWWSREWLLDGLRLQTIRRGESP